MEKRLKKGKDKQIAGVCSGIAEYFDIDVNIVRIFCILICLFCSPGIIVYAIFAIALEDDNVKNEYDDYDDEERIDEYNEYNDYSEDDEWNDNRNYDNQKVYNSFEHTKKDNKDNPFELK